MHNNTQAAIEKLTEDNHLRPDDAPQELEEALAALVVVEAETRELHRALQRVQRSEMDGNVRGMLYQTMQRTGALLKRIDLAEKNLAEVLEVIRSLAEEENRINEFVKTVNED